jgi:hypothetical protein
MSVPLVTITIIIMMMIILSKEEAPDMQFHQNHNSLAGLDRERGKTPRKEESWHEDLRGEGCLR